MGHECSLYLGYGRLTQAVAVLAYHAACRQVGQPGCGGMVVPVRYRVQEPCKHVARAIGVHRAHCSGGHHRMVGPSSTTQPRAPRVRHTTRESCPSCWQIAPKSRVPHQTWASLFVAEQIVKPSPIMASSPLRQNWIMLMSLSVTASATPASWAMARPQDASSPVGDAAR